MPLSHKKSDRADCEDDIIACDAVEHKGTHDFALRHEAAEDQQECRLDGAHTGHIWQGVREEEHQAREELHLPEGQRRG